MVYPNLIAEYKAAGYPIDTLSSAANVTNELMQDILDGKEVPTWQEASGLLSILSQEGRLSKDYLFSPVVSRVDPLKNDGRYRRKLLGDGLRAFHKKYGYGKDFKDYLYRNWISQAEAVFDHLQLGHILPYAYIRRAMYAIDYITACLNPIPRRGRAGIKQEQGGVPNAK